MTLRSIVCLFNGDDHEINALETSIALAKEYSAYLRIVHVVYMTRAYVGFFGEAVVTGGWEEAVEKHNQMRLQHARQVAEERCAEHQLALDTHDRERLPRAVFVPMENTPNRTLVRDLSLSDLIVIGSEKGSADVVDQSVVELALFSTGRPILVVRPQKNGAGTGVSGRACAIAWNDSPEAIHALMNARPLIETAPSAHVFVATRHPTDVPTDDQRLALDYLAAHGIPATLEQVNPGHDSAATSILQRARDTGCGYIVMGAYGHSVFREMLLGGFSETMLEQSELPLLMCH